jgi:hypothetical protein
MKLLKLELGSSVGLGPARAVFKAARLARNGLKKSQTLIVFVGEGRSFKKSEPGQVRMEWGRFGRWLSGPQANTTRVAKIDRFEFKS